MTQEALRQGGALAVSAVRGEDQVSCLPCDSGALRVQWNKEKY